VPDFPSVFIAGCVPQLIDEVSRARDMNTINDEKIVTAPSRLVAETRAEFRNAAVSTIESTAREAKMITLDLAATREMDATGLGTLVAIQSRAKQFGMTVKLVNVTEEVLTLLSLTELLHLFVVESA
jgi:anti-anti-sigma factor